MVEAAAADRCGDWIQTFTGKRFWPLDPRPGEVWARDIAHALAMKCRFGGHSKGFYSVAEHSIHVSRLVPPEEALWGLMHDASEAYLPDVCRPIKADLTGFREIERRVLSAVAERFGLPPTMPPSVKRADTAVLATDARELMGGEDVTRIWSCLTEPAAEVAIHCWAPHEAKRRFEERFWELLERRDRSSAEAVTSDG